MTQQFRPHPIYYLLTLAMLFLAGLLLWGLRNGVTAGDLLFLMIALVAALYFGTALTVRITLTTTGLCVQQRLPLGEKSQIDFRQLIRAERGGRLLPTLTLLYHPLQANGLVDVDEIAQLVLPLLSNQEELQQQLTASIR